jgi:uncharacterized protein (TIGR03437 family)
MRRSSIFLALILSAQPAYARHAAAGCGTSRETPAERQFFHRQALRHAARPRAAAGAPAGRDIGNIAVMDDANGVVARQNDFNLDGQTLQFTPQGGGYRYAVSNGGYDAAAAASEAPLAALDDDDSRLVRLPFTFPFFGAAYSQVYVNSDGNLTFTAGDSASTDRSLGRMTAGPPRIAPLFDDLNPALTAGGVRVLSEPARLVVSWVAVPEYAASGGGPQQTFQVRLYPDGRIEFSYAVAKPTSAVVGIAPGALKGSTSLADFLNDPSGTYTGAVAERFGNALEIDIVTLAQQFYRTHEDAYDYLVVYNNMDIAAMSDGVVAYENTVRSRGSGYGADARDDGALYGSAARLQAILNMGPLSEYPADPNAPVPARAPVGDTPLTTLGHETGHLFLAYASVPDAANAANFPMLGYQNAHWAFTYDSEASLLEGERIVDRGPGVSYRFLTTDTVQGYSPLDQYLMGFLPAASVADTFYVAGTPAGMQQWHPVKNYGFDGNRQNVSIGDVVQAMGRRTPDSGIAQRHFRFAFILVVAQGTGPSAADLAKIDQFQQQYEGAYGKFASGNAAADTSLRCALNLSLAPAAGIVAGLAGTATITVATPPGADLAITLQTTHDYASFPASVTLRAGASAVSFPFAGITAGVEEVTATPAGSAYETAYARVQVAGTAELKLVATGMSPVSVRLTDANGLVYSGARILALASEGGSVAPASAITDAQGRASFQWTPGSAVENDLQLSLEGLPSVMVTLHAGSAVPVIFSVLNAASFQPGVAAGALEAIFGAHLGGAQVRLNGAPVPVMYTGDSQINFYVPADTRLGAGTLMVQGASGVQASTGITVTSVQPGIFAAAPIAGTNALAIYGTGFGPTLAGADGLQHTVITPVVFIGAVPVQPLFSGLSPGTPGLYQINVAIPPGLNSGLQGILVSVNLAHSNTIYIEVP